MLNSSGAGRCFALMVGNNVFKEKRKKRKK